MREFIIEESKKIREQFLWRSLSVLENSGTTEIVLDGKRCVNFSSNDYLGYSQHPYVIEKAREVLSRFGCGGRSSRLISGTLGLHRELEEKIAKFKNTESALLFPTGFMANLGVISALLGAGDAVIMDRLNHASLVDAAKLSRCRLFVYEHGSSASLEKTLVRTGSYGKRLVVTDSLFSMDGDIAPLNEMLQICGKHKVWLMVDDAHATGVFGEQGIGIAEHQGLLGQIDIVMGTLSKALGSQGGFVCGSKELIEFLVNRARPFIFTTALSPVSCAAAMAALELVGKEPERRRKLLQLSGKLRKGLREKFPLESKLIGETATPIVPFWTGSAENTLRLSRSLRESGIFVPAIRPPTIPRNECRLRFSLTSEHTEEQIENLIASLSLLPLDGGGKRWG